MLPLVDRCLRRHLGSVRAIILTELLLEQSGYALQPVDRAEKLDEAIEELVVAIVNHECPFAEILEWFEARIRKLKPQGSR